MEQLSGIILAGGNSLRLGQDKSLLKLGDTLVLDIVCKKLASFASELIVAVNQPEKLYKKKTLKIVRDEVPSYGPLGGILTGLKASSNFYSLVVGVDMPFVKDEVLRLLLDKRNSFDIVVPKINDHLEVLCALYSKNCVVPISQALKEKNFKVISFFGQVEVGYLEGEELTKADPEGLSFFNINNQADLTEAREIFERENERD